MQFATEHFEKEELDWQKLVGLCTESSSYARLPIWTCANGKTEEPFGTERLLIHTHRITRNKGISKTAS